MDCRLEHAREIHTNVSNAAVNNEGQMITQTERTSMMPESAENEIQNMPSTGSYGAGASGNTPDAHQAKTLALENERHTERADDNIQPSFGVENIYGGDMEPQAREIAHKRDEIRAIRDFWDEDAEKYHRREEELKRIICRLEAERSHMELARVERDRACGYQEP